MPQEKWLAQAHFLHEHIDQMNFDLATPTTVSIWFQHDPNGEKILQLVDIIVENYDAYHCGPATMNVPGKPNMWSFGFRTPEALRQARRVLTLLPEELQAGPPHYM